MAGALVLILIWMLTGGSGHAEETVAYSIRSRPPTGFEDLTAPQTAPVDVFFLDAYVGTFFATFAPGWLTFEDPASVVAPLPGVAHSGTVTMALTGEIRTNAALACGPRGHAGCGTLEPDVAGIIFDADRFRVDIFVNPDLLVAPQEAGPRYLPGPQAGVSTLQSTALALSGSTSDGADYTVRSLSLVAYDTQRFRTETSVSSEDWMSIDVVGAEIDRPGWRYDGGLYRTSVLPLLGEGRILGVGVQSSTDLRMDLEQIQGNQITVFLPTRGQVEVLRDGRLLASRSYPAGNQVIDTSPLPDGAYEVTLRIRGIDGSVREEGRFFVKSTAVPPAGAPRYVLEAGFITARDSSLSGFSGLPVVHAGSMHRLSRSFALGGDLLLRTPDPALEIGGLYLSPWTTLSVSAFGATSGDRGAGIDAFGALERFSYSASSRRIWAGDGDREDFDLAPQGSTQLSLALSYSLALGQRLGFRASWNERDGSDDSHAYGPSLFWPLGQRNGTRLDLFVDATRTENDTLAMARLRLFFDQPRYTVTAETGYALGLGARSGDTGAIGRLDAFWKDQDLVRGDLRAGGGVAKEAGGELVRGEADYNGPYGRASGQVEHRLGDGETVYGANAFTNVLGNADRLAWGGEDAFPSGVVIAVEGNANAAFAILVDGRPRGEVQVGERVALSLPQYELYEIRLEPLGAPSVQFDASPRQVSLLPGTVKTLKWIVNPVFVAFGRLVDADGRPVAHAALDGGLDPSSTDGLGFFQLELSGPTILAAGRADAEPCTSKLEPSMQDGAPEELVRLGDVVCR